jgi:hypothetical protein
VKRQSLSLSFSHLKFTNVASSTIHDLVSRGLKVARIEIEPIEPEVEPEPEITTPRPDGEPSGNPDAPGLSGSQFLTAGDEEPSVAGGDDDHPDPATVTPAAPTVAPTNNAPPPKPTEGAPEATPTPVPNKPTEAPSPTAEPTGPTATEDKPPPTATEDAPKGTAVSTPDATDSDPPITSDSPGGLSGDSGDDSGGIGDGPKDDKCLFAKRSFVDHLFRRCSRLQRPAGWTAYDDINHGNPDTARVP